MNHLLRTIWPSLHRHTQRRLLPAYSTLIPGSPPPPPPSSTDQELDEFTEQIEDDTGSTGPPETVSQFLVTLGQNLKHAGPRNWLGTEVPFPMNPSFTPPIPVSNLLRTEMYRAFMQDPKKNSVRVLSQRHGVSMKRIDAILRLKGMEEAWLKNKPLQTGFQVGMELVLGVTPSTDTPTPQSPSPGRRDANEADTLEEMERRDNARQRYQRLYWESLPEDGREPIVPSSLEQARSLAVLFAKTRRTRLKRLPRLKDTETIKTPKKRVQVVTKTGRPTVVFVDVGGQWIDHEEQRKREIRAKHRSARRSK